MSNNNISETAKRNIRKRFNKTVWIYILSLGSGLIIGIFFALAKKNGTELSDTALILGAFFFTVFLYGLTWAWYKGMDEFERKSFNEAGNIALHFGFLAFPWYILHEYGVLPELESIYLLLAMCVVFMSYYYIRKLF